MQRFALAICALLLAPGAGWADPTITTDQILAHFGTVVDCAENGDCQPRPRKVRKVCISAADFCGEDEVGQVVEVETKNPGAFDLLVTFELGSDRLSAQARENLTQLATALKSDTLANASFAIDGHTDARGSEELNEALSERRAASVVRFLAGLGVPRDRLFPQGLGEYLPLDADPLAAINRRVEATIRLPEAAAGRSP